MNIKNKTPLFLITFGVVLYAALMNFSSVMGFAQTILAMIFPIILGLVFAFILNVPMSGIEKIMTRLLSKGKKPPKEKLIRNLSFLLTLVLIFSVVFLVIIIVIPELVSSIYTLIPVAQEKIPQLIAELQKRSELVEYATSRFGEFNLQRIFEEVMALWGSALTIATSTAATTANMLFGLIISMYILMSKPEMSKNVQKLMRAHLKPETVEKLLHVGSSLQKTYSKFLSGQCVEAIILGLLIFITFSIFRLPYAGLIGFMTSVLSFIPYVGAFLASMIGAFLILLVAPSKFILSIVVYLVVQFIESQFIYPQVVGSSVGLSPLWTLIAALLGGKLFGLAGIIFFIPLVAVIIQLVDEYTEYKLAKKTISKL